MTSADQRKKLIADIADATHAGARQAQACNIVNINARTLQRWQHDSEAFDLRTQRTFVPAHALSVAEREQLLFIANSAEYSHLPPSQLVPMLADKGLYYASESTFYRVLRDANQLAHRRTERPAQVRTKPRAVRATAPNQLYSWDITYLPTTIKGIYFYLYVFLDIFSRKIVGWQIYSEESAANASDMIADICQRERVAPGQVTLHSDNGSAMKGATMLSMLQTLGVVPSLSRPSVSNDNPYSEAAFKTLKYRPDYAVKPFATLVAARAWAEPLLHWYNHSHRHSGIRFVTPEQRHRQQDIAILTQRKAVYTAARVANPKRWSGNIRNWDFIQEVHLNPSNEPSNNNTNEVKKAA
jgi:putative transposase